MGAYEDFISKKSFKPVQSGFEPNLDQYPLFDYQRCIVEWACKRGKAAVFADTGLGKTIMQLSWADQVAKHTGCPVLILAPLAVSDQTIVEGKKYGIDVEKANHESDAFGPHVYITNYEQLHKFSSDQYKGIVLDESSILKGMDGKMRQSITDFSIEIPYKLSCTATPSPNDFMELGTQSEFLGIMTQLEMLAMFFVNDMSDTGKWRLKGHGAAKFWEWMATWSICIRNPSDIGFDGSMHNLPPINYNQHTIETTPTDGLFVTVAQSLNERNQARRDSVEERCRMAAEIANSVDDQVLIWCHLNDEGDILEKLIDGSVQVKGADKPEHKRDNLLGFASGKVNKLISKPKIAGYGMNWQKCNTMIFVGLSDSWESYYQAVRRCWRFGQQREVNVHVICADTEGAVVENIKRKDRQNAQMADSMVKHMRELTKREIFGTVQEKTEYNATQEMKLPDFMEVKA